MGGRRKGPAWDGGREPGKQPRFWRHPQVTPLLSQETRSKALGLQSQQRPPFPSLALSGRPLPHSRATLTLALAQGQPACQRRTSACSHSSAGWEPDEAPAASASGENPLPGGRPPGSHWVLQGRAGPGRKNELSACLYKTANPSSPPPLPKGPPPNSHRGQDVSTGMGGVGGGTSIQPSQGGLCVS